MELKNIKEVKNTLLALSLIFGILFSISGFIEILIGFSNSILNIKIEFPLFVGDVFGGFALLAIGVTYFLGVKKAVIGDIKAVSYLFTASIIGLGIGIVSILLLLSNAIGFLVGLEDWKNWSLFKNITIYLILGVLSIIPYKIAKSL
ncbi:hypothetical protein [Methanocaldococcus sp.]